MAVGWYSGVFRHLFGRFGATPGQVTVPRRAVCLHGADGRAVSLGGRDLRTIPLLGREGGCDVTDDLIQFPGAVCSDDADQTFALDMEDGADLSGYALRLTIREDPRHPRGLSDDHMRTLEGESDADPADWAAVVTSTTTATPPAGYQGAVTVARADMAALAPGRYRYVVEVAREDAGQVYPVVPPTWLSVRPAVSR